MRYFDQRMWPITPWDNLLGRYPKPGSREEISILAYNYGIAPWQQHPQGNIDERFDPFHIFPVSEKQYRYQAEEGFYRGDVSELVEKACETDLCRNPLNDQDPEDTQLGKIASTYIIQLGSTHSMLLYWDEVAGNMVIYQEDIWNFEPLWTSEVMKYREKELTEAQWRYMKYYEYYSKMMRDIDPEADFSELTYHPSDQ